MMKLNRLSPLFVSGSIAGLLIGFYSPNSAAADVPPEVVAALQKSIPGAKVLAGSLCKLGAEKRDSFGLLVKINANAFSEDQDPLRSVIAMKKEGAWDLHELPRGMDYSKGGAADFLRDFWGEQGFKGPFEIRCTVLPSSDPAISPKANGEFVGAFARTRDRQANHLCFLADAVYNSWACFTINPATSRPELSFVQMNAD